MHASNVTGAIQPIDDVGEIARAAGAFFSRRRGPDGGASFRSTSRGRRSICWRVPATKGCSARWGRAFSTCGPASRSSSTSVRQGGTGTNSEDDHQPERLPEKYEAGNHNVPGLFGLEAALAWLEEQGVHEISRHERELTEQLIAGLAPIKGLRIHGPRSAAERVGVVSVTLDGFEPHELAAVLDSSFGIETRAGLHCARAPIAAWGRLRGAARFA